MANPMRCLIILVLCSLGLAAVSAVLAGNLVSEIEIIFAMPWGRFVIADIGVSFFLLSTIVYILDGRIWLAVGLFFLAFLVLGSLAYGWWLLVRITSLQKDPLRAATFQAAGTATSTNQS